MNQADHIDTIKEMLKEFLPFTKERFGYDSYPYISFAKDAKNAADPLGKTAYYEPESKKITVYVIGRHPKDIMRSISHELVHHTQNIRGEFSQLKSFGEGYAQNDEHLREMEREAYEQGNLCFRDWEDSLKRKNKPIAGVRDKDMFNERRQKLNSSLLESSSKKRRIDEIELVGDEELGPSRDEEGPSRDEEGPSRDEEGPSREYTPEYYQSVIDALHQLYNYIENREYEKEDPRPYIKKVYGQSSRKKRYGQHVTDQMIYDKMVKVNNMLTTINRHSLFVTSAAWKRASKLINDPEGPFALAWPHDYDGIARASLNTAEELEKDLIKDKSRSSMLNVRRERLNTSLMEKFGYSSKKNRIDEMMDEEGDRSIPGMEGPFTYRSGAVLYYDPKEGKYYDRSKDMYLSHEEAFELTDTSRPPFTESKKKF